jgi:hypothetical protein
MNVKGLGSKYHISTTVFNRSEQDHKVVRFAEVMHSRLARALNRSGWLCQPEGVLRFSFAKSLNRSEQLGKAQRFIGFIHPHFVWVINRSEPGPVPHPDPEHPSQSRSC